MQPTFVQHDNGLANCAFYQVKTQSNYVRWDNRYAIRNEIAQHGQYTIRKLPNDAKHREGTYRM